MELDPWSARLEPAAKQSIKQSKNRYSGSLPSVDASAATYGLRRRGLPIHTADSFPGPPLSLDPLC